MAKREDGEGTISFDTAINLDGMEEDVKDLKSMANDIAKSIENMGKNVEKAVGDIDTSNVQNDLNSLSKQAIKAAEASMKVDAAMAKLDDVDGPQAIIASIKEYKKQLEELEDKVAGYSSIEIGKNSETYKEDKAAIEELNNAIEYAKSELRDYYMRQQANKMAIDQAKQALRDQATQAKADEKAKAAAAKQAAKEKADAIKKAEREAAAAARQAEKERIASERAAAAAAKQAAREEAAAARQAAKEEADAVKQAEKEQAAAEKRSIARKKQLSNTLKVMGGYIGRTLAKATGLEGTLNKVNRTSDKLHRAMSKIAKLAKTALFFYVIRKAMNAVREQMGGMLSTNKEFADSLSAIKGNLLVAFQPIYTAILPYINALMAGLKNITNQLAVFINTLFGKSVSASNAAAKALNKQAAATKNVSKQTQLASSSIDEFNILSSNTSDDSSTSTGVTFDVQDDAGASSFAEKVKEAWNNIDMTDIGRTIGEKITNTLQSIDWNSIQTEASNIAVRFATFFNGINDGINWNTVGQTVSNGLNTILQAANTFLTNFDFLAFGNDIGDGINSGVETYDWSLLGITLANMLNGAFDWIYGFLSSFDWSQFGLSLAQSISDFINTVDWQELGMDVSGIVIGLVSMLTEFLRNVDWAGVANSVFQVIEGIDWGGIIRGLIELIVTAFLAFVTFFFDIGNNIGEMLIEGLKGGIWNLIKNIGTWIYDNMVKPIIDAVCNFFGIHSPSTVFAGFGQFMMEGLCKGISGAIHMVRAGIQTVVDAVTYPFRKVGTVLKSIFTDAWNGITKVFKVESFSQIASSIGSTFTNALNRLISGINTVMGAPINTIGNAFAKLRNVSIVGAHPFSFLPSFSAIKIPFLAKGAVIPPNSPFTAVLGDQKHGTNIETPENLLRKIMREELAARGEQKVDVGVDVELRGEMADLFKAFVKYYTKERDKTGYDPLLGI